MAASSRARRPLILASGNDVVLERNGARFVAKVPDQVAVKVEFETEEGETEFEIELKW